MAFLRRVLAVGLMLAAAGLLGASAWMGIHAGLPDSAIAFSDAEALHQSIYSDVDVSKLLEQNLRMQEAMFSAQKEAARRILQHIGDVQAASVSMLATVMILLGAAIFCLIAAFMVLPRRVVLHHHSVALLEKIMWESWVQNQNTGGEEGFSVQESAYPVALCGCSPSGVPVTLCNCDSQAVPVHLCGCSSGYLDKCRKVPPVHLCGCGSSS